MTMDANSLLAVLFVCVAACLIVKRVTRSINISRHGWPPPYLDSDGDIHRPETELIDDPTR